MEICEYYGDVVAIERNLSNKKFKSNVFTYHTKIQLVFFSLRKNKIQFKTIMEF
jgi:hypothetical protein